MSGDEVLVGDCSYWIFEGIVKKGIDFRISFDTIDSWVSAEGVSKWKAWRGTESVLGLSRQKGDIR